MLALVMGLALLGLLRTFTAQSDAATTRSLVAELRAVAAGVGLRPAGQSLSAFGFSYLRSRPLPDGQTVAIALPDGSVIGSAGSEGLLTSPLVKSWARTPPTAGVRRHLTIGDTSYLVAATPLVIGNKTAATIVAAADLNQAHQDLGRVRTLAIGEGIIALLAAVAGSYLMLRRLLGRVGRITTTAAEIGGGALDRRLNERDANDEVGQLAATFDAMADRLSEAMETQRRLLSDVSHQLRTPLTVARGHLEVLDRTGATDPQAVHDTVALVIDEIDHMKALVERLLLLGHALEPDFVSPEPVDLRSFCADLMDAAKVLASRQWLLPPVPDVVVEVDPAKLRGALLNLIENAAHATQDGDVIALVVERDPDGTTTLSVDDGGPGIEPDRRASVLERFARPGAADSEGSGLGLAIARAVAQAHGGDLVIEESSYGGARVSLILPPPGSGTLSPSGLAADDPACVS